MTERRTAILVSSDALVKTGATCLMTTELRAMGPTVERAVQLEEYLAHGVMILSNAKVGKTYNRVMQVEKMRETAIDMQPRPYKISAAESKCSRRKQYSSIRSTGSSLRKPVPKRAKLCTTVLWKATFARVQEWASCDGTRSPRLSFLESLAVWGQ